ncbi:hypothetical protein BKA66DRAFT_152947 [Pyrenochaeta sp. MPI-SDFR-AT-0127]|nr:hypothetical protein BKA66DRAFT_152947 [Pyrenochaeta sp. MPI-SDFR-AT-0127]
MTRVRIQHTTSTLVALLIAASTGTLTSALEATSSDQDIYTTTPVRRAAVSVSVTPSSFASPSSTAISDSGGFSKGAIAGIVLAVLVCIAAILGAILFCLRKRKNANKGNIENSRLTNTNAQSYGSDHETDALARSHREA